MSCPNCSLPIAVMDDVTEHCCCVDSECGDCGCMIEANEEGCGNPSCPCDPPNGWFAQCPSGGRHDFSEVEPDSYRCDKCGAVTET